MDGAGPVRVLHVDDDEEVLDVTATFLEREGDLVVETATDGEDALNRLETERFDCVVSDYDMPGMDGLDLLTAIRDRGSDVPFILFTGHGNEAVASDAISAGVSDYLQKETGTEQYEVLANRIRNYAAQYRTAREIEQVRRRYELVARTASDLIYEWDGDRDHIVLSAGYAEHFGEEPPLDPDQSWWLDKIHPEDRPDVVARVEEAIAAGQQEVHVEYRVTHADGGYRHVTEDRHHLYDGNGDVERVVGAICDVTDRRRREQRLDALHEATRDLITVETVDGVVETVSRAAEEILDISIHAIYRRDGALLRPETATDRAYEVFGTPPTVERGEALMWDAVERGAVRTYTDVTDHENVYNEDTPIRSEICAPIEGFGIFVAGSTVTDDFSQADVTLVQVLLANAEAALARIEDRTG